MAKNSKKNNKVKLLIVESPAKANTIEKYLGEGYQVAASIGHLFDLPRSRMAIDIEHDFEPEYITIRGKAKILKELYKAAKKAESILLASDNDREGEAIAFHLKNAILKKYPDMDIKRIVFNEITPTAIRESVNHPGEIDEPKVIAQKARRILDRLVGYRLSPILWKKVKNGLSAGRVQSVALKLICDRDKLVDEFVPQEYWTIDAELAKGKKNIIAQLVALNGEKPVINSEKESQRILENLKGNLFKVVSIKEKAKTLKPQAPFTTSKLQQVAANRLGFTSRKTMRVAQSLYEGINIGKERVGLITYMRTDSTRVSDTAIEAVRKYLGENYPEALPEKPNNYTTGKKAQDAHEAIRPTYADKTPASLKSHLSSEQFKLYSIIWERFVSSQMTPAKSILKTIEVECKDALFRANASVVLEKGFQAVLKQLAPKEKSKALPVVKEGETLELVQFLPEQHYTQGPAHYTDASIIKALEENGIGRPSTYAPIISVLLDRYYVVRKNKKLMATVLGKIIDELLNKSFPDIVDLQFTAAMEERLDQVEEEQQDWVQMLRDFYTPFNEQVEHVMENLESIKGVLDEETEYTCEKCGKMMVKKLGRYGFFLACSGFPECMNSKPVPLADCPKEGCGGKIVAKSRQGSRGKTFYGCTNFPDCDFVTYAPPVDIKCPQCGYFLVEKSDKKRGDFKVCSNAACDYIHLKKEDEKEDENDGESD
ncbi:MAG: type I DNA topoisomerase [Spirochaetales bacterium]|nr:type I DNA topoisomerase [Spirochaetales bacterium]